MFSREIVYNDFNGNEHTEKFYFHLSTPDMMDIQFNPEVDGDMGEFVRKGMQSGEGQKLWIIFKLLVVNSYGRRSEDGARFTKKAEFTEEFLNSPAFEKFFEWLLLDSPDGKNAKLFWEGVVPERIRNEAAELEVQNSQSGKKKLTEMSREELERAYLAKTAANKKIEA